MPETPTTTPVPSDIHTGGRPPGKVIVVMPAMNAATTLQETVANIPRNWVDEVILVDDHSSDGTVALARQLPLHLVWHPHNAGYGANQKTCYLEALQRGADAVVMLHPDGQYDPSLIPAMVEPILTDRADLVLGSRFAEPGMALRNGMPRWKYVANRGLTISEKLVMGTHLTEAHTGYRAYSRKLLLTVPFLRNALDFSFDSELIMQTAYFNLRIMEVPLVQIPRGCLFGAIQGGHRLRAEDARGLRAVCGCTDQALSNHGSSPSPDSISPRMASPSQPRLRM